MFTCVMIPSVEEIAGVAGGGGGGGGALKRAPDFPYSSSPSSACHAGYGSTGGFVLQSHGQTNHLLENILGLFVPSANGGQRGKHVVDRDPTRGVYTENTSVRVSIKLR